MKTKKPSAIVYGLPAKGNLTIQSDIYFEEGLLISIIEQYLIFIQILIF